MLHNQKHNHGFTLIELLVVMAIIAALAALLLPALNNARVAAKGTACLSRLKDWGFVIRVYADDFNDMVFLRDSTSTWLSTGSPYDKYWLTTVRARKFRLCPGRVPFPTDDQLRAASGGVDYGMNRPNPVTASVFCYTLRRIKKPSEFMLMMDADTLSVNPYAVSQSTLLAYTVNAASKPLDRHGGWASVLFADGHVASAMPGVIRAQATLGTWFDHSPKVP